MAINARRFFSIHTSHSKLLESSLQEILSLIVPQEEDHVRRLNTITEFTSLVQSTKKLKGLSVKPFGSFVSNLYTKSGDLDLSIQLSHDPNVYIEKSTKLFLLLDVMQALKQTGNGVLLNVLPLARVPLLIYKSNTQNIKCDVTVNNHMAIIKTNLIHRISEMDWRFRDLVLLIKEWANAHDINNAKERTLNSFSIYLLVIFHFQTCKPAILPPLRDIYDGNVVSDIIEERFTVKHIEDTFAANIAAFTSENKSSLCELYISFFEKFSNIRSMMDQHVISTYSGKLENILHRETWLETSPYDNFIIEDPFKKPVNAACAVNSTQIVKISNAFIETYKRLTSSTVQSNSESLLVALVRPKTFSLFMKRGKLVRESVKTPMCETPQHHGLQG